MTIEEAISYLMNFNIWFSRGNGKTRLLLALKKAIEALEKQIPKKPNSIEKFRNDNGCIAKKGKCPCCNMIVIDYIDGYGDVDSCFLCGQALDWSDEE